MARALAEEEEEEEEEEADEEEDADEEEAEGLTVDVDAGDAAREGPPTEKICLERFSMFFLPQATASAAGWRKLWCRGLRGWHSSDTRMYMW